MFKEFKEFAFKGNAIDLAVGIILGAAFGAVVVSLVNNVIMPPIGALLGGTDFSQLFIVLKEGVPAAPYATVDAAAAAGAVTLNYGMFINAVIYFVLVAIALFFVVKVINKLRRTAEEEVSAKECPYCKSEIALAATKCPACTSALEA